MMRKVYLHGALKEEFGPVFELDVATAGEAIRALAANFPKFMTALKDGYFSVVRGKRSNGLHLDLDDVNAFKLGKGELHIAPVIAGSKRGGLIKAILGVALIGVAIFFSAGALAAPLGASSAGMNSLFAGGLGLGITNGNVAMFGAAMALTGVSQLLTKPEKTAKDDGSFTLNGPGNSYEQGQPVPVIYGEVITGGVLISGGIDIENIGTYASGPPGIADPTQGS